MNREEAKEILLLYRPGSAESLDSATGEALELADQDPELGRWFENHRAFQRAIGTKLRTLEPPVHLKAALLASQKAVRPAVWWRNPTWLAAAAGLVLLASAVAIRLRAPPANRFGNFEARMVSTALREYRMDLVTADMSQLRRFMASRGAPGDYEVTRGLARLQLIGGGLLRWRSNPVSMVCFDRGDKQMLFLFVLNSSALSDPPPTAPATRKVNQLFAVSWSRGGKTYLLAGPEEEDFLRKYL